MKMTVEQYGQLGDTEPGKQWCLKALHPAEPSISAVSIPDGCSADVVREEFNWTVTVGAPSGTVGTWGFDGTFMAHPIQPIIMTLSGVGSSGTVSATTCVYNPQMALGGVPDSFGANFLTQYTKWRFCGSSITVHLDANATTDSGTFVCSQTPMIPNVYWPAGAGTAHPPVVCYSSRNYPTYNQLMQNPKAYNNNAKFGLYVPLKLQNTSQHWHSQREYVSVVSASSLTVSTATGTAQFPTTTTPAFPFEEITPAHYNSTSGNVEGVAWPSVCNDIVASFAARGLHATSTLVFKIKQQMEFQVAPTSVQAPHLQPSPPKDDKALQMYSMIAVKLPDAFEASANDSGKVLGWISRGLKALSPVLAAIPGYGAPLSMASTGLASAAGYGARKLKNKQKKKKYEQLPEVVRQKKPAPARVMTVRRRTPTTKVLSGSRVRSRYAR